MKTKQSQYLDASFKLMPNGLAWQRSHEGMTYQLMDGFALQYAIADHDVTGLLTEMHPHTAVKMLPEWEEMLGLPECGMRGLTIKQRQDIANIKYHFWGSLHHSAYERFAKGFGYDVKLITRYPHHCLRGCNYPLWNFAYNWLIEVHSAEIMPYRFWNVLDNIDDPLRFGTVSRVECLLSKYEPAHLKFIYFYKENEEY